MTEAYTGPAIVELKGFIRTAGFISECEMYGEKMARLDIPGPDQRIALTQYFPGSSIHRLTPTTDEIVYAFGPAHSPQPVARYELPAVEPQQHNQEDDGRPEWDDSQPTAYAHLP